MLATATTCARLPRVLSSQKRAIHDIVNIPGRTTVAHGPPGRSAVTGRIATVFGCTGFLGRYLVSKLARAGTQVIVPYREEDSKRHLKVMGDLGQIVPMEWDLRRPDQIAECIRHSDTVFNLTGRNYETSNFSFDAVHADGAELIAKVAADVGVPRFFHISHLNASPLSHSKFYQSKAKGEEKVKAAFPGATIVRPAAMFGYEDKLLNHLASYPIFWRLNHGKTTVRPVHVMDVAQALTNLFEVPSSPTLINLPGPSTLTHEYLLALVASVTYQPLSRAPVVPKRLALLLTQLSNRYIWWSTFSPDEVERRYINDLDIPGDWDKVGVQPTEIEDHAITYLRRYRSAENFTRPVILPASREAPFEFS